MSKTVKLVSLSHNNFKGSNNVHIDFNNDITTITGDNATGKTRNYDAFMWLLFDKDTEGRTGFGIKSVDSLGDEIHNQEIEVKAILSIDGVITEIKKTQSENWTKPRGQVDLVFSGNVQSFRVDNVEKKLKDYKLIVDEIVQENIFKMITKTSYFTSLPWKDMRNGVLSLVDAISDEDILKDKRFKVLADALAGKDIEEFTKKIKGDIADNKKAIKDIPARIEENKSTLVEISENEDVIVKALKETNNKIANVDSLINNANKSVENEINKQALIKFEIKEIETAQQQLIYKGNNPTSEKAEKRDKDLRQCESKLEEKDSYIKSKQNLIESNDNTISVITKQCIDLLESNNTIRTQCTNVIMSINDIANLVFDEHSAVCPTCKHALEDDKLDEAKRNFNTTNNSNSSKLKDSLSNLKKQGLANKAIIDESNTKISKIKETNTLLEKAMGELIIEKDVLLALKKELLALDVSVLKIDATQSIEYKDLCLKIKEKQALIKDVTVDNTELIQEKADLNIKRDELKAILTVIESNQKTNKRVEELEAQQRAVSQLIADSENLEFKLLEFNKFKIETVESSINKLFKLCSFKMFEILGNGNEVECCRCLASNGVDINATNTAERIKIGLDIIRVFSDKYDIKAPIFIDNSEGITQLPTQETQIIALKVVKGVSILEIS